MRNILICLLLSSCVLTKKQKEKFCNTCPTSSVEYVKDSVYIKDTIVNIKPDSSTIEALLECDSLGNVRIVELSSIQGQLLKLETELKNNTLKTKAKTDTIKVFVKGNTEIKYIEKTLEVEKEKTVYKDYWWKYPMLIWCLIMTLIFIVSFRKPVFSFLKGFIKKLL